MDSKRDKKNKNETLFDEKALFDTSVSDIISKAFDNVELSTIGKSCLDARVKKSLTQEQASDILKVLKFSVLGSVVEGREGTKLD